MSKGEIWLNERCNSSFVRKGSESLLLDPAKIDLNEKRSEDAASKKILFRTFVHRVDSIGDLVEHL